MTPHPASLGGACDCHVHIYDPAQGAAADGSGRVMPEATLDAYREVQARLGLQRAVIVQPNAYGTDNMTTLVIALLLSQANGCPPARRWPNGMRRCGAAWTNRRCMAAAGASSWEGCRRISFMAAASPATAQTAPSENAGEADGRAFADEADPP